MHDTIPEQVYYTDYSRPSNEIDGGRRHYYMPILTDEPIDSTSRSLYWEEHRRQNFSDVCHAKVVRSVDPAGPPINAVLRNPKDKNDYNRWVGSYKWAGSSSANAYASFDIISNGTFAMAINSTHNVMPTRSETRVYISVTVFRYKDRRYYYSDPRFSYGNTTLRGYYNSNKDTWRFTKTNDDFGIEEPIHMLWRALITSDSYFPRDDAKRLQVLTEVADKAKAWAWAWYSRNPLALPRLLTTSKIPKWEYIEPQETFLLHEPDVIMHHVDDLLFGKGTESYWRNVLIQNAYLDAVQSVPRLNENSISNLLEIIAFIKGLVMDHRIDIPRSLSSAWLSYRYQYGTSKLDAEEAIKFVHRRMDLNGRTQFKCYGTHSIDYKDTRILCRCEFEIENKVLTQVQRIWRSLYTYGLSPSFYTVWDMIPYSFIVDWFIPIGDIMSVWDAQHAIEEYYDISNVNFSLSYDIENDAGCRIRHYTRWLSSTPPELCGRYFLEKKTSMKTVGYRILDALSLILK